jgi:hypothetical protein
VFGKLIQGGEMEETAGPEDTVLEIGETTKEEESNDLREHMVGILFSRSKLTNLQRQVRKIMNSKPKSGTICCILFLALAAGINSSLNLCLEFFFHL